MGRKTLRGERGDRCRSEAGVVRCRGRHRGRRRKENKSRESGEMEEKSRESEILREGI